MNYSYAYQVMPKMPGTFTEMNHLGAALATRPALLETMMTELFSTTLYSNNSMTSELTKGKRVKEIGTTTWEYPIAGGICRPATVLRSVYTSNSSIKPGEGTGIITLDLDTADYIHGDVLSAGGSDKSLQIRVIDNPIKMGRITRYRFKIMNDSIKKFIPFKNVKPGALWGKLFSQYEEGSDQSGSTSYNAPSMVGGSMSRYRKMYKVTGDVASEVLAIGIKDAKGRLATSWINHAEQTCWTQWYQELERGIWYSRKTRRVLGSTNRALNSGAGLQQQLETGLRHFYNNLTGDLLKEFVMDMRYGRIAPSQNDTLIGFTGEYGMLAFHEAIMNTANKQPIFTLLTDKFTNTVSSPYSPNALSYGARFTEWLLPNGVTLKLVHNPVYDDPEINFEIDELTGKPTESMRITFFNMTGKEANSNITLVNKKQGYKQWYVGGAVGPSGPMQGGLGAHSGDYYEVHMLKQQGVQIMDPTACGELILQRA